ncbi:hypothetical protein GWA97_11165 [Flavobacterium sp. LaA7.5]|nr:hypothetical protein [Flavobacterium salilacus subsp. altitudinum]
MKRIFLFLPVLSFLFFLSCSDKKEKTVTLDEKATAEQEDSQCTTQYMECVEPIEDAYAQAVEKAADKFRADSISKNEYDIACEEAYSVMQKEIEKCDKVFEDCLLEE